MKPWRPSSSLTTLNATKWTSYPWEKAKRQTWKIESQATLYQIIARFCRLLPLFSWSPVLLLLLLQCYNFFSSLFSFPPSPSPPPPPASSSSSFFSFFFSFFFFFFFFCFVFFVCFVFTFAGVYAIYVITCYYCCCCCFGCCVVLLVLLFLVFFLALPPTTALIILCWSWSLGNLKAAKPWNLETASSYGVLQPRNPNFICYALNGRLHGRKLIWTWEKWTPYFLLGCKAGFIGQDKLLHGKVFQFSWQETWPHSPTRFMYRFVCF